ncbi:MAG: putative signal transducing protein [Candidatus Methylomirabilales bacterium]
MAEELALFVEAEGFLEADFIVSLLEAYDIPYLVKRENPYAVDARYTIGPLARHQIFVKAEDLERAREILDAEPDPRDIPGG